jgi:hypothetical protein
MHPRWRRLLPLVVPAVLALLFGLMLLLLPAPPQHVSRADFDRIQAGMSLADVEVLLGGPPGDYRTVEVDLDVSGGSPEFHNVMSAPEVLLGKRRFRHEWWQGNSGNVWVCFDENDRVVTKEFTPGKPVRRGVRDWLGW